MSIADTPHPTTAQYRVGGGPASPTQMRIDLDHIEAIDVHTHAQVPRDGEIDPITDQLLTATAEHFRSQFAQPPILIQYANTVLQDKVLFGSDYPVIIPDRWLADFEATGIRPEVRPKILKHNAARLLGLGDLSAP